MSARSGYQMLLRAGRAVMSLGGDVACWRKPTEASVRRRVRFLGYSGQELLAVSLSEFDPTLPRLS
jgi:hypothetical protein